MPAIASLGIFQFLWVWNDLLIAIILLPGHPVLTYQITNLIDPKGGNWHLLTAAAFLSMIVPMFVFFSGQKRYPVGEPDHRRISAGSLRELGNPLVQPTADHEEEARPLEVPDLPGRHVEGGRRSSWREKDFDPRQLPCQLLGQVPDWENGCDDHGKSVGWALVLRPFAPKNEREEEEKEGCGFPELPQHMDVPCQMPG